MQILYFSVTEYKLLLFFLASIALLEWLNIFNSKVFLLGNDKSDQYIVEVPQMVKKKLTKLCIKFMLKIFDVVFP